jgi:hypothetical protein
MGLQFSSIWYCGSENIYEDLSAIFESYIAVAYICSMGFTQEWPGLRLAGTGAVR